MNIIGVITARMGSSRFPGKPLYPILDMPMVEHVYRRAKMYNKWDKLLISTCDDEIIDFCKSKNFPVVKTSPLHKRALERTAETASLLPNVKSNDVVVCVQGDEPMMTPEMVDITIQPIIVKDRDCTVLGMEIKDETMWQNEDIVKIIHNIKYKVLYTSRSPIPNSYFRNKYDNVIRRIYGILAFKYHALLKFINFQETFLELVESCDSNRILDMDIDQYVSPIKYHDSFSVDSPEDIKKVEQYLINDPIYKIYKDEK